MRHVLGVLAMLLSLAACGDEPGSVQTDPPTPSPTPSSAAPVLVHATAGGGDPADEMTRLPDDAAVEEYVAQFAGGLGAEVQRAAEEIEVGDGEVLAAQVVAIGCVVPPGATVEGDAIVPHKVPSPLKECFAPVTTVALAAVPA